MKNVMHIFSLSKKSWTVLIGNAYDHYDSALYGLMAPFLAPLFFPTFDPIVQLILAYGFLCTSLIERPLSVLLFSRFAEQKGEKWTLSFSLLGAGLLTLSVGFMPTHANIGVWAPILLFVLKFVRGIFLSGERVVARFFLLHQQKKETAMVLSSLYDASTVFGILLASFTVFLVSFQSSNSYFWRVPFILGGLTALVGASLRGLKLDHVQGDIYPPLPRVHLIKKVLQIFTVHNFSQITYVVPFVFFNAFIPLITSISLKMMMGFNTIFLLIDFCLLPLLAGIFRRKGPKKVMIYTLFLFCTTLIPLFFFLENASLWYVMLVRFWIVLLGLVFLSPLSVWTVSHTQIKKRYMIVGMASALSSAFIGKTLTFIGLSLWKLSGHTVLPAAYIVMVCLPIFWVLKQER